MPERIYMNRVPGQERIHVELRPHEIADLLDDLPAPGPDAFQTTKDFYKLLVTANKRFVQDMREQHHA